MPYPGQVFEDPDYYDDEDYDYDAVPELLEEDESDFDPFNTVNSQFAPSNRGWASVEPTPILDFGSFWIYTTIMMHLKQMPIRKKTRAHYVLFAEDSPFKPKKVESKKTYQRRPKHKGRDDGYID